VRVYATPGTLKGAEFPEDVPVEPLRPGRRLEIGGFRVDAFAVAHDAREPVGYIVTDRYGQRVGIASDTGHRPARSWHRLREVDVLVIESNHDPEMLRTGPYPWPLKRRVGGPRGHLSNRDAADGVAQVASDRLQCVVLYHLSRTNNHPSLALEEMRAALDRVGSRAEIKLSSQFEPTDWIEVESFDSTGEIAV